MTSAPAHDLAAEAAACFEASMAAGERFDEPYPHWILQNVAPEALVAALRAIDLPPPHLDGVSGKRELHNDERWYFDAAGQAKHPAMGAIAEAFQNPSFARRIGAVFDADLDDTFLRIEYAVDSTGFWLQPHTDLGVKRLTILHYISNEPGQDDLGTDIYHSDKSWAKRTPFGANSALVFTPGDATYHGFEERPIAGLRKSLIINYVTHDWRDREQLCFPDAPVRL